MGMQNGLKMVDYLIQVLKQILKTYFFNSLQYMISVTMLSTAKAQCKSLNMVKLSLSLYQALHFKASIK